MADTYTKIADLIDPEVMGDMVSARIPKKLRVAPFAKVDDTLAGVPGDTITVPAYAYIGDADIVAEGEAVTIEKMTTSTRKATVKKAMKGIGLTDEAVLSGYGNPVGEANTQLAMAIAAKIDNDCMDVLQTAILDFNVGIFFLLAASSIGVVGILLAGWSSNNKYSLIGAMRSGAQMISYELSVGLSILTIVILTDTMQLSEIVERQADGWFLFKGHIPALIAFIIYLIAGNAEVNRGPFDLPEAESELTAGYHTEYSGMHFGLFYVAEFVNLFIIAAVATTIFLGGWMPLHIPGLDGFNAIMDYIPGFIWFFGKSFFVVWLLMWIKWTFPRLRIDQILTLEWKYLVPIGLCNLLLMVIIVVFKLHF